MVPVRTALHYFPKHKGKVIGIILCGFGISASMINLFAEYIINPNGVNPDKEGYFSQAIAKNMSNYLMLFVLITAALSFIGICLVIPYSQEECDLQNLTRTSDSDSPNRYNYEKLNFVENENFQNLSDSFSKIFEEINPNETLSKAICSGKFAAIFTMSFLSASKESIYNFSLFIQFFKYFQSLCGR